MASTKKCPLCEAIMPADAKFCGLCGESIEEVDQLPKNSRNSIASNRGKKAGYCPECGSELVYRRARRTGELYRGCTNFDGGCRWNDRSY